MQGLTRSQSGIAGFSFQLMISIFSPRSSFTIALTRAPFIPTHAPTGSTSGSLDHTAILVLLPASLAILLISTMPSFTSVTSDSNRRFTSSGCVLDTRIFGPFGVCLYFKDIYLDTFCRLEYLTFYLLVLGQDRIHFSEVDADVACRHSAVRFRSLRLFPYCNTGS